MGWMELLMIGVVALIVVGPKDLPVMFQSLGKMTAKVRRMAREFQSAMSDAADATGAGDIAKDLKGMTSAKGLGIDKLKDAADNFDKWEPGKETKVMGSETAKLAAERAEQNRKIKAKMLEAGQAKLDKEKAEAAAAAANPKVTKAKTTKTTKPAGTKPKTAKAKAEPAAKPAAKAAKPKTAKPKTAGPKTTGPKTTKPKATKAKTTKPKTTKSADKPE